MQKHLRANLLVDEFKFNANTYASTNRRELERISSWLDGKLCMTCSGLLLNRAVILEIFRAVLFGRTVPFRFAIFEPPDCENLVVDACRHFSGKQIFRENP